MNKFFVEPPPPEAVVLDHLQTPGVRARLEDHIGSILRVIHLGGRAYRVSAMNGNFILRFPRDTAHMAVFRKEERVQSGLRGRIHLRLPDTQVINNMQGCPPFAIHTMISGEPLTSEIYTGLSPELRDRLVVDLATFFAEMHAVPLAEAGAWLELPETEMQAVEDLALKFGKPVWFGPEVVAEMRVKLMRVLDRWQMALFDRTVEDFDALRPEPGFMVFGHGDMHGFNMAIISDELGPRLAGAFDLECAWILDIHEDFFRLSLVSEDLLDRVLNAYQEISGGVRQLRRERISIYYRAFLFYLMAEQVENNLDHLKAMLEEHVRIAGITPEWFS